MRKLKLETLQVESFATTGLTPSSRGTVEGNADVDSRACPGGTGPSYCVICYATEHRTCEPDTYDVRACGETQYMDCTFGCTQYNSCNVCWIEDTRGCEVE